MRCLFYILILFCVSESASAKFYKYHARSASAMFGKTVFDIYTPFYESEDRMLHKIFYYPGKPLAIPEYPVFPSSLYFQDCAKKQDTLYDWLSKIPTQNTLEHFVFFMPCGKLSTLKKEQINDFLLFWEEYSNLYGANRLKNNLIASSNNSDTALMLVEALPEMYTSLTLLNKVPALTHLNRYKGIRTRIYAARKSAKYSELKIAFEKFKNAGARTEWIELDVSENDLVKEALATKRHWDWIQQISWEN